MLKFKQGSSSLFRWEAPHPIDPDTTPALSIWKGSVEVEGFDDLSVVAGPATITSISNDRYTLTASEPVSVYQRATADWGNAFFVSQTTGIEHVRVHSVVSDKITLVAPLVGAPTGILVWSTYFTRFSSSDVTAALGRDYQYRVQYTPWLPGEADGIDVQEEDSQTFAVVKRPFSTGVSVQDLLDFAPDLSRNARDRDYKNLLRLAEEDLIARIRQELVSPETNRWEDSVDGSQLKTCLLYLATSLAVDAMDLDRAKDLRARFHTEFHSRLRSAWVDLDGDGFVDPGEDQRITGLTTLKVQKLDEWIPSSRNKVWRPIRRC